MGLIRAFAGAVGGTLSDQWLDYIYCEALPENVLVQKGSHRSSGRNRGNDNVISNGSKIAINEGQFMIIVEDGKIVDFSAEPGGYVWDNSSEPSMFAGDFGAGLIETFKTMGQRFKYGGEVGRDQRVYYINTKELRDAKFGTPEAIPFLLVDSTIGFRQNIDITCFGTYSYRITDPIKFYTNVSGNVKDRFLRDEFDNQVKMELVSVLGSAFGQIAAHNISYEQLPAQRTLLTSILKEELKPYWEDQRGISVERFNIASVTVKNDEDNKQVLRDFRQMQKAHAMTNPDLMAGSIIQAQNDALLNASKNANGAMTGFMGMGMMNQMTGGNQMNQAMSYVQQKQNIASQTVSSNSSNAWSCTCGHTNEGKFCENCGTSKPIVMSSWTCQCGHTNDGKFCSQCGQPKPNPSQVRCDKCGTTLVDSPNLRFCPECGDVVNELDRI